MKLKDLHKVQNNAEPAPIVTASFRSKESPAGQHYMAHGVGANVNVVPRPIGSANLNTMDHMLEGGR